MKITYPNFTLLDISDASNLNNIIDYCSSDYNYIRVSLPTSSIKCIEMQKNGFFFADRTIQTTINLNKINFELEKLIRHDIVFTNKYKEELINIAVEAFEYDRRFHISLHPNKDIARQIIESYFNKLDEWAVCLYKDIPIGFIALQATTVDNLFIYLAATDSKYRLTNSAMSLYSFAIKYALKNGKTKVEGRVSTQNSSVINIYNYFGATYSKPIDIFIKEQI